MSDGERIIGDGVSIEYDNTTDPTPRDEARPLDDAFTNLVPYIRHDTNCAWHRGDDEGCTCGAGKALDAFRFAYMHAVLAAAPRADRNEPMQFGRDFMLEDLWAAYREGAKDARAFGLQFGAGAPDDFIERCCDGYVKLVVERAAARAPGRPTQ